jgi:hypothetical protein
MHFRLDPRSRLGSAFRKFMKQFPFLDGLLGHDVEALIALYDLFNKLRLDPNEIDPELLITGDFTQLGKDDQFGVVFRFLNGETESAPCLNCEDWNAKGPSQDEIRSRRAIAGNHDFWRGKLPFVAAMPLVKGNQSVALKVHFDTGTHFSHPIPLGDNFHLRFVGVNSDHNVEFGSWNQILARGSFADALSNLKIPPAEDKEIRVMLIHHSPSFKDPKYLYIYEDSLNALRSFGEANGICLILTGHTHEYGIFNLQEVRGWNQQVWEMRCGTATQVTNPDAKLRKAIGSLSKVCEPNTVLVHRVCEGSDGLYWQVETYWRKEGEEGGGFVCVKDAETTKKGGCNVRVWPSVGLA